MLLALLILLHLTPDFVSSDNKTGALRPHHLRPGVKAQTAGAENPTERLTEELGNLSEGNPPRVAPEYVLKV